MADQNLNEKEELLMRYVDGFMSAGEKLAFEAQISSDEALRAEVESLQLAVGAIDLQQTRDRVGKIHAEMRADRPATKAKLISMKRIAQYGTVAAAAAVILFFVLFPGLNSPGKLYDDIYVEYRDAAVRGNTEMSPLAGMYSNQNYKDLIQLFTERQVSNNGTDSLFAALAYLKLDSIGDAEKLLKPLSKSFSVRDDAEFYLSLTYLKSGNYSQSFELMKKIRSEKEHIYHDQITDDQLRKVEKLK